MPTKATLGYIDVTWIKEDADSGNGRFYPAATVVEAVTQAQKDIEAGVPLTSFSCHEKGLADDASQMVGLVERVWMEGERGKARISLLDTQAGRDTAAVIKGGGLKTVSLRASDWRGSMTERHGRRVERVDKLRLGGIDCTMQPGIPSVSIDTVALESARHADAWRLGTLRETVTNEDVTFIPEPALVEGWLGRTKQSELDDGDFAWLSDDGKTRKLPYKIHGTVDERGWRAAWNAVHGARAAMDFSGGPSKTATIKKLLADKPASVTVADDTKKTEAAGALAAGAVGLAPCGNANCGMDCTCGPGCTCTPEAPCGCTPPGDDADDDDETGELEMTEAEVKALVGQVLAEARHTHAHSHTADDGSTYTHTHAHSHNDGTQDHDAGTAHMHGHEGGYFESVALADAPLDALLEAVKVRTAAAPAAEVAAARGKVRGVHEGLGALLERQADAGNAGKAGDVETTKDDEDMDSKAILEAIGGVGAKVDAIAERVTALETAKTETPAPAAADAGTGGAAPTESRQKAEAPPVLTEREREMERRLNEALAKAEQAEKGMTRLLETVAQSRHATRRAPLEAMVEAGGGDRELSGDQMIAQYGAWLADKMIQAGT